MSQGPFYSECSFIHVHIHVIHLYYSQVIDRKVQEAKQKKNEAAEKRRLVCIIIIIIIMMEVSQ